MASISKTGSKGHHTFKLDVTEKSTSTTDNSSSVSFSFSISSPSGGWRWEGWGSQISYEVIVNGTKYTGTIPNFAGNTTVTLKSDTLTINHNTDGTKSISFSFSVTDTTGQTYTCGSASASGTMTLTTIPRYANITSFSVNKRDETSVTFAYSCDAVADYAWYSKDDGTTWADLPTNNIVGGLTANTSYKFKLKVRRKDSQLTTISGSYAQTTYDYPYCSASPDFIIGNAVTLSFYNPCGRTFNFSIIANGRKIYTWEGISGTSYTGAEGVYAVDELYASIPNAQSGKYKVEVVYGMSVKTRDTGNTYRVRGNENPKINGLSYKDIDNNVVAITGNNQQIVQNQSLLQVIYEAATPKNSATISKYAFELNGRTITKTTAGGTADFGKVDSANDLTLTLTVTDSRGLTSSKTMKITMLAHSEPTAIVTLERLNNYEDETYLTVDASISSVNGKNFITNLGYRYESTTGESISLVRIPNNEKQTLQLDKTKTFVFTVAVEDAFGSVFLKEYTLYKGVFPLFIDTEKNAVGINEFTSEGEALRVAGGVARINDGIVLMGGSIPYLITVTESGSLSITKWNEGE